MRASDLPQFVVITGQTQVPLIQGLVPGDSVRVFDGGEDYSRLTAPLQFGAARAKLAPHLEELGIDAARWHWDAEAQWSWLLLGVALEQLRVPLTVVFKNFDFGLDPLTAVYLLRYLHSFADQGTQVILTTRSPWVLDHVEYAHVLLAFRRAGEEVGFRWMENQPEVKAYDSRVPPGTVYVHSIRELTDPAPRPGDF